MKKVLSFAVIAFILTTLLIPVVCASESSLLYDYAELLSESEASDVQSALQKVSDKNDMDIAVLTVDDIDSSAQYMADNFYLDAGLNDDGCLLLVKMSGGEGSREIYLATHGYGITAFTDYGIDYICGSIKEDMSAGNYKNALIKFAYNADDFISEAKNGKPYDTNHKKKELMDYLKAIGISLGAGLIISAIAVLTIRSKYKPVQLKAEANDYLIPGSLQVHNAYDRFIYTHITRTAKPKNNSGSGSSTHSTSGNTFGGGGIKF